jgi:hypothetical protein
MMEVIDVEKALERVWHRGLFYKLIEYNFPKYLAYFVTSYLNNRKLCVTIGDACSNLRSFVAGL